MPVEALVAAAAQAFGRTPPGRLAVAVSGGSDLLAALHLFHAAGVQCGWEVVGVTVDHRLRPEAASEAALVAQLCAGLGIGHTTLVWDHDGVVGNVMDQARRARYGLIAGWAAGQGIADVVLGHTADDQAETFLMGLARSAGLDGLSGMRPTWVAEGVRFHRPFLKFARADLRKVLTQAGVRWVDDPSNHDASYQRVKARQALRALAPLGISMEGLVQVIANLDGARRALQDATATAARALVREVAGSLEIDRAGYLAAPPEVQRRLTIAALLWLNRADYPPRGPSVGGLLAAMCAGRDATLAGVRFRVSPQTIRAVREPKAVAGHHCGIQELWDGRWRVTGPHDAPYGLRLRALGDTGLKLCKTWRESGISRDALLVSPSVWQNEALIAAPLAGFGPDWTARISAGFNEFVLSH